MSGEISLISELQNLGLKGPKMEYFYKNVAWIQKSNNKFWIFPETASSAEYFQALEEASKNVDAASAEVLHAGFYLSRVCATLRFDWQEFAESLRHQSQLPLCDHATTDESKGIVYSIICQRFIPSSLEMMLEEVGVGLPQDVFISHRLEATSEPLCSRKIVSRYARRAKWRAYKKFRSEVHV